MKIDDIRDVGSIKVGDMIIEADSYYLVIKTYSEGYGALEMESLEVVLVEDTLKELIDRFDGYTIVPKDRLELKLV